MLQTCQASAVPGVVCYRRHGVPPLPLPPVGLPALRDLPAVRACTPPSRLAAITKVCRVGEVALQLLGLAQLAHRLHEVLLQQAGREAGQGMSGEQGMSSMRSRA